MIDTIRIELKDISQGIPTGAKLINGKPQTIYSKGTNNAIYEYLKLWGGRVTYDVAKGGNRHIHRELMVNTDKETYSEKFRIVNRQASSNYKITILASIPNDSMIIEFSLPKYYFGTNVFQFCESPLNEKFNFGENVAMEYHFKRLQSYLQKGITSFMSREFPDLKVNYTEVYLRRIDLCYNAIFRTVQQKLDYLNMQKQLQKKYDRGTKNRHYKESIFINTKDYSFKIYDKGEEFRKSDFKKLRPFMEKVDFLPQDWELDENQRKVKVLNKTRKKNNKANYLDAGKEKLLDLSSRILRFEMTFRNSFFSYVYNNKVRGSSSKIYLSKKKIFYSKLKSIETRKDKNGGLIKGNLSLMKHISETIDKPVDDGLTVYSYLEFTYNLHHIKPEIKEDINYWVPYYKAEYKIWTLEMNKERNFALKLSPADNQKNSANLMSANSYEEPVNIKFGSRMFGHIAEIFKGNIDQFIPKKYDSYSMMLKKLTDHNRQVDENKGYMTENEKYDRKLSPNYYKTIFLVLKTTTLKKYSQLIEMPHSTYYRIKKHLALLDITENMVIADFDIDLDLSFENYYQELNRDHAYYIQFIDKTMQL